MKACLLYRLRSLISADFSGAWASFGGLAAQLNHLAIAINISVIDTAAIALAYGRMVREFLVERARARREMALGDSYFFDFLSVENAALKLRATAEQPRPSQVPKQPKAGTKKNFKKGPQQPVRQQSKRRSFKRGRTRSRSRSKKHAKSAHRRPTKQKAMGNRR